MPILASAIFISPAAPSPSLQNPTLSPSLLPIKRAEPDQEVVQFLTNKGLIQSLKPKKRKPKTEEKTSKKIAKNPAQAPLPAIDPSKYQPRSSYDDVYKAAGEKYDIPWQILYGLHMTETGCRNGPIMNAIGSGAQGPMQFMPGTWRAYGIDGDGDGKADINNAVDAIHGAANYLAKHGTLDQGLHAYGGNFNGTLAHAEARGYTLQ